MRIQETKQIRYQGAIIDQSGKLESEINSRIGKVTELIKHYIIRF